jgi:hypothetical protein
MYRVWNELTDAEIDVMDGSELDFHVADALGWEPYRYDRHHGGQVMARHSDSNVMRQWHPHDDANQALEVWAQMPSEVNLFHALTLWADGLAEADIQHEVDGPYIGASGTFCEAICRTYLKARLADREEML